LKCPGCGISGCEQNLTQTSGTLSSNFAVYFYVAFCNAGLVTATPTPPISSPNPISPTPIPSPSISILSPSPIPFIFVNTSFAFNQTQNYSSNVIFTNSIITLNNIKDVSLIAESNLSLISSTLIINFDAPQNSTNSSLKVFGCLQVTKSKVVIQVLNSTSGNFQIVLAELFGKCYANFSNVSIEINSPCQVISKALVETQIFFSLSCDAGESMFILETVLGTCIPSVCIILGISLIVWKKTREKITPFRDRKALRIVENV